MKKLISTLVFLTASVSGAGNVDSYFSCVKQISNWFFSNTQARGDGAVTAATRLCIASYPNKVSSEDLNCVKGLTARFFAETQARGDGAVDAAAQICVAK